MALQIAIRESGEVTILDLQGRATISDGECDLLRVKLEELLASGVRKVLLNLADLTQVDSAGFSIVAKVCVTLRDQGGDLRFVGPNGGRALIAFKVLRLLDMIPTSITRKTQWPAFRPKSSVAQA